MQPSKVNVKIQNNRQKNKINVDNIYGNMYDTNMKQSSKVYKLHNELKKFYYFLLWEETK